MCTPGKQSKRECIDKKKMCDGINDCSNGSDEQLPQCNEVLNPSDPEKTDDVDTSSNNLSIAMGVSVAVIIVIITVLLILCYCRRKKGSDYNGNLKKHDPEDDKVKDPLNRSGLCSSKNVLENHLSSCNGNGERGMAVGAESTRPLHQPRASPTIHRRYQQQPVDVHNAISDSESNIIDTNPVTNNAVISGAPPSSNTGIVSGIGCGSSGGLMYDRSHVTGASSSTTSSSGMFAHENSMFGGPPPSPVTSVDQRPGTSRMQYNNYPNTSTHQRQHRSMHSLPRSGRHHHRGERGPPSAYRHYNRSNQVKIH